MKETDPAVHDRLDHLEAWGYQVDQALQLLLEDHRLRMMAGQGAQPAPPKYRQALEQQQRARGEREAARRNREQFRVLAGGRA